MKARFGERHLLLIILGALTAAYAAAFLMVGLNSVGQSHWQTELASHPRVRWMRPPTAAQTNDLRYLAADLLDPSLMSLPDARGFSGPLWQQAVAPTYHPVDWDLAPAFLGPPASNQFHSLLNPVPLALLAQAAAEKIIPEAVEPPAAWLAGPVAATQSVVRVRTGLRDRAINHLPPLPVVATDTALRPTVVRVGVDGEGVVRYAILERGCGNEAVDAQASALARQVRFTPQIDAAATALNWGLLQFFWATVLPPPTAAGR